jgi:hypothetical protein
VNTGVASKFIRAPQRHIKNILETLEASNGMGLMPMCFLKAKNILGTTLEDYHTLGVRRTITKYIKIHLLFWAPLPGGLFGYFLIWAPK